MARGKKGITVRVFITGITGTIGTALAKLHNERGDTVYGCARSEATGVSWIDTYQISPIGALYITDALALANPLSDIGRLLPTMDRLYHCAAMKHVDICELQPEEAYWQNVGLTSEVARACRREGVRLIHISSDKACLPQSTYGATKLLAEKVVLHHGGAVVRLGNVIGSSGSVFERWKDSITHQQPIYITDPLMTRYFIGVRDAAKFIADNHEEGYITLPNPMLSVEMGDILSLLSTYSSLPVQTVGQRSGETRHQWLVAPGHGVLYEEGRILLSDIGPPTLTGLSSETAERWDVIELLSLAGMLIGEHSTKNLGAN